MQKPHQHSRYQWNFSFFRTNLWSHLDLSTLLAPFHRLQTCLGFLLLLPMVVVVVALAAAAEAYHIQLTNVVELQHSPFSNNTSVTTYVHRMIISPPSRFKHMKNDELVPMLFQCLLHYTQQKLHFCLILLLRYNASNSVYINLRHSVYL